LSGMGPISRCLEIVALLIDAVAGWWVGGGWCWHSDRDHLLLDWCSSGGHLRDRDFRDHTRDRDVSALPDRMIGCDPVTTPVNAALPLPVDLTSLVAAGPMVVLHKTSAACLGATP